MSCVKAILTLWLSLISVGCNEVKSISNNRLETQAQTPSVPAQTNSEIPPDTVITLERTFCYGECPVYKITIHADGTFVYKGKKYVKKEGEVRGKLSREQVKELIAEAEKINYFALRDNYSGSEDGCRSIVSDVPSYNTSIRMNGKSKAISHYSGCLDKEGRNIYPPELTAFENKIDETVNSKRWVKGL